MGIYYLYLKTHNQTGLKYLGRTCQDPYTYQGSGTRWCRHIKKHGYDVTTEVLKECSNLEEIAEWGNYYSELWNITESKEFANLMAENGDGRGKGYKQSPETKAKTIVNLRKPGVPLSESHKAAISKARNGIEFSDEHKKNLSKALKGNIPWNKGKSNPHARTDHMNNMPKIICPHCGKTGAPGGMKSKHFDNCTSPLRNS